MKKDWEAEKNIFELTIKNLEETAKKQISEVASWRVEAEKAAKKAQELAIKIVESGVKASPKTDAEKIEKDLMNLFPKKHWKEINSSLVRFGKTHTSRMQKDEILEEIKKIK